MISTGDGDNCFNDSDGYRVLYAINHSSVMRDFEIAFVASLAHGIAIPSVSMWTTDAKIRS